MIDIKYWEDLKGQHIRVLKDGSEIFAIGNIVVNEWIWPNDDLGEWPSGTIQELLASQGEVLD